MNNDFPLHTRPLDWIRLSAKQTHFVEAKTGRTFTPVGFNYDHDEYFRLLEDYWHDEWEKVEKDFSDMRNIGANIIRIHLQLEKFLCASDKANEQELQRLDQLIALASSLGVYIDLVGLCCYHSWEVPDWYNDMDYPARWEVQSFFWQTLSQRYKDEPTIFCFDLMNEPVVPGRKREPGGWLGKEFAGKSFIQFITLTGTPGARSRIAQEWLKKMIQSVRRFDQQRLLTVGLMDWCLASSSMQSGFYPEKIVHQVDFISAHLYPELGKPGEMVKKLQEFCVGKPVLLDETFQLKCTVSEQEWFLQQASSLAEGFLSFYTDLLPEGLDPCDRNRAIKDSVSIFKKSAPLFVKNRS